MGARAIHIRPMTAVIGAEVSGVDLRAPLEAPVVAQLERALHEHLVLFFRDQPLTPEQHIAFARQFGTLSVAPFGPKHPDHPALTVLDQTTPKGEGADSWHTDNTFMPEPPMGSILRALQLPSVGGDTCFASMYAAYEALSPALRELIDGLTALHDLTKTLRTAIRTGRAADDLAEMQRRWPPMEHPVVRTHPRTGRRALFVNANFTTRLIGLTDRENDVLLPFLIDHVRSPDFQCRFRWQAGSITFWDNRCAQHYGVPDYSERRLMHRVTLEGDRPFFRR
jgi:taurine dioxygenase